MYAAFQRYPAAFIAAGYLLLINLLTFFLFAIDKRRAVQGGWRIRERTLLLFSALGGGLFGFAAMFITRHKTRKPLFLILLPLFITGHCVLLYALLR